MQVIWFCFGVHKRRVLRTTRIILLKPGWEEDNNPIQLNHGNLDGSTQSMCGLIAMLEIYSSEIKIFNVSFMCK